MGKTPKRRTERSVSSLCRAQTHYNTQIVKTEANNSPIMNLAAGADRTAGLASWLQSLYPAGERRPILVGGAAVELYTGGAYTTGDLDFVGSVPPLVAKSLSSAGFTRLGRHWIHEPSKVFLEFPGTDLEPSPDPVELDFGGRRVSIIPIEGLLADRLAAWKFWHSGVDAVNALLLLRSDWFPSDLKTARRLCRRLEVDDELERLVRWHERLAGQFPSEREIEDWLDAAREAGLS